MKRSWLLVLLVFSLVLLFSESGSSQVNEYSLIPVDLQIGPSDSTVEVDIHINTVDTIGLFLVTLFAEGTSNPVLDTILTGGLADFDPPAFASPPSLLVSFPTKLVNPYGPPSGPLIFFAHAFVSHLPPSNGLFCRMFYRVSGSGTLTFRTAVHSTAGATGMNTAYGPAPINWPSAGEVGSFSVTGPVNEFSLVPVDLEISPCDSVVQVNINVKIEDAGIAGIVTYLNVALYAEGTSNPVLNCVKTGGITWPPCVDPPPAFDPPSLVWHFTQELVIETGPPEDPLLFVAVGFGASRLLPGDSGLYCRMFYNVSGPGTLSFRTAVHSSWGPTTMYAINQPVSINWPDSGEVGSFEIVADAQRGDANYDGKLTVADIVYLISYLFKGGPLPFVSEAGDFNCDGQITVTDVILLLNYLFKGGPPSPC